MIELTTRHQDALIRVRGELDLEMAPDLRDALSRAVGHHRAVVVDLTGVPRLDSAGLGVLIRAHGWARHSGGILCLVGPSRFVLTVLHTMHVDGVFPIFGDCPAAFDWIDSAEPAVPEPAVPEPAVAGSARYAFGTGIAS